MRKAYQFQLAALIDVDTLSGFAAGVELEPQHVGRMVARACGRQPHTFKAKSFEVERIDVQVDHADGYDRWESVSR